METFPLWCGRLAKDYGGAVVIVSYYAVAILGLILLGVKTGP